MSCLNCVCLSVAWTVILLSNVGFVSQNWWSLQYSKNCTHGLWNSPECNETGFVYNKALMALWGSTLLLMIIFPCFIFGYYLINGCAEYRCVEVEDYCCGALVCCAIGGVFGFALGMVVLSDYDHTRLGWSFYLSVAMNSIILFVDTMTILIGIIQCICENRGYSPLG